MNLRIKFIFPTILILNFVFIIPIEEEDDSLIRVENDEQNIFEYYYSLKDKSLFLYNVVDYALTNLLSSEIKNTLVDSSKLKSFCEKLLNEYNSNSNNTINPYHNIFHAANVVENLYIFLKKIKNKYGIFNVTDEYTNLDIFTLIISAAAHDFRHPGRTNSFYRQNKNVYLENKLKEFNGQLEAYHINETKKLINSNDQYNILSKLNEAQQQRFYLVLNSSINSTDNSFNSEKANFLSKYKEVLKANTVSKAKKKLKYISNYIEIDDVKVKLLGCLLHASDLSTATRNYTTYISWTVKVNIEFCNQNKEEVEYGFENLTSCYESDKDFYKGEKSFIEFVVKVFYDPLCEAFTVLDYLCTNIGNNLNIFSSLLL